MKLNLGGEHDTIIIFEKMIEFLPPTGKILDIGCYDCRFKKFLPKGIKYYGLDPIDNGIRDVTIAKAEKIPFKNNFFDRVYMISTIDHIENPKQAIKESMRVLKPGGWLGIVITYINPTPHLKKFVLEDFLKLTPNYKSFTHEKSFFWKVQKEDK